MSAQLTPQRIAAERQPDRHPVDIEVVEETGSTNADLLQRVDQLMQPTLRIARIQTAGRGRNGRVWHSAPDASLTFSLAWKLPLAPHRLLGLPLAIGVATTQALDHFGVRAQLKWPNDILIDGSKLAGILIETRKGTRGSNGTWAVVGIGMNLTIPDGLGEKIGQPAACLPLLAGIDRNRLMATLLDALCDALALFGNQGLTPFVQKWNDRHAFAGHEVAVIDGGQQNLHGIAVGIDPSGRLLLDTAAGRTAIISGDVSLRAFACPASLQSILSSDDSAFNAFAAQGHAADRAPARRGDVAEATDSSKAEKHAAAD